MNTKTIIEQLTKKKVQDYTFTIIFFLIFSFFVFGAIRPNVLTVFRLQKELEELRGMDGDYEQVILNIVDNQAILEANRDHFYLLDEAIPQKMQAYKLIDDVRKAATDSGVVIESMGVDEINIKSQEQKKKNLSTFMINVETTSSQDQVKNFITNLVNQRRLKTIQSFSVIKADDIATGKIGISQITMEVEGFYTL